MVVLWVNSGAPFPQVTEQMAEVKAMVPHFLEVRANVFKQNEIFGIPTDVLAENSTLKGQFLTGKREVMLQSWINCVNENLWIPMTAAIEQIQPKIVYRGQKKSDKTPQYLKSGEKVHGVQYIYPIDDWTDDDVWKFLRENNIPVPSYYEFSIDSLDCWHCTAWMEKKRGPINWLKEHDPEKYEYVVSNINKIKSEVEERLRYYDAALK